MTTKDIPSIWYIPGISLVCAKTRKLINWVKIPDDRAIGSKIEVPGIRAVAGHESRVTVEWLMLDCAGHAPGAGAAGPSSRPGPEAAEQPGCSRSPCPGSTNNSSFYQPMQF